MTILAPAVSTRTVGDAHAAGIYRPENYADLSNLATVAGPAIQAAIDAAAAAGSGTVLLGPRDYPMGTTTLVFPPADITSLASGQQVNLQGCGMHATTLTWSSDLGAGAYAISCGPTTATQANGLGRYGLTMYLGYFADFAMVGPGGAITLGTAPASMSGICWGSRRNLYRIYIKGFYAGLDIVGDNAVFENVRVLNCYYGAYWNQQSDFLYGDLVFRKCFLGDGAMAAIGLHNASNGIKGSHFNSCYISDSPYGILLEAGGGSFPGIIGDAVFDNCMFEHIGNAMIHEENVTKKGVINGLDFRKSLFGWKDALILTAGGRSRRAMIEVGQLAHSSFYYPRNPQQFIPGSVGLWVVEQFKSVRFIGDAQVVLDACTTAGLPWIPIGSTGTSFTGSQVILEKPGYYTATFQRVASFSAAIAIGDVLLHSSDAVQQGFLASVQPVAGVALSAGSASGQVVLATLGNNVTVNTTGSPSANQWLKKNNSGTASAAVAQNDGSTVGWAKSVSGSTAVIALKPGGFLTALRPLRSNTVSMTLSLTESGSALELNSATGVTVTVPPNSSVAFPLGTIIDVIQMGAGQITIAAGSGVTLRTARSLTTRAQYSTVTLRLRAADEWVLSGDLS